MPLLCASPLGNDVPSVVSTVLYVLFPGTPTTRAVAPIHSAREPLSVKSTPFGAGKSPFSKHELVQMKCIRRIQPELSSQEAKARELLTA